MKKWMCAALAALLLCSLTACGKTEEPERQDIFAMDTYMSLAAYGDGAREALAAAAREINRLEQELSRTVSASDIYKLNDSGSAVVSEETAALLQSAMTYSAATGGLFDVTVAPLVSLWGITTDSPRVPSQSEIDALLPLVGSGHIHMDGNAVTLDSGCAVDLGGIAKGYASDRVAQVLRQYAVTGAAVSLGGNVYVCGQKSDGSAWSVAVQDPKDTGAYGCVRRDLGGLPAVFYRLGRNRLSAYFRSPHRPPCSDGPAVGDDYRTKRDYGRCLFHGPLCHGGAGCL